MTYVRVVPRDFFNEAKLLNCLGKLSIAILDGNTNGYELREEFDNNPFEIDQSIDGSLYVTNYQIYLQGNDDPLDLYIPVNCKDRRYPLMLIYRDEYLEVLDEDGNFILDLDEV
ncbi:hypothetical protein [Chroococcidiopsis sp.]|uniref:hypothetical protein n=1 Tax=Chroococcidiopsis sp. TaxID=3088168 RepID=UPI003F38E230